MTTVKQSPPSSQSPSTDYFAAVPSFFLGMASIFDFGRVVWGSNSGSLTGFERDVAAIRSDWETVGRNISWAIGEFSSANNLPDLRDER